MAVGFAQIPADLKVPLFHLEFDSSRATAGLSQKRALIIGQPTTTASGLSLVGSAEEASALYGQGSSLARMIRAWRANDSFGELWAYPVADDAAAAAATKTLTIAGAASETRTLPLYIGAVPVPVAVTAGDAAAAVATAVAAAVNANARLPFAASAATAVVTLTARNKGSLGGDTDVRVALYGAAAGEAMPAGLTLTVAAGTAGGADPALTGLAAALGDEEFEVIAAPYTAANQLNALRDLMDDVAGRWSWARQIYGHAFTGKRESAANLIALGGGRNDQHVTIVGYEPGNPTSADELVAQFAAQVFTSISADPARPLQTLRLVGAVPTPTGGRFTRSQQQSLLSAGIATVISDNMGAVRIQRAVTTYQRNAWGITDRSYLDCETLFTLAEVVRRLRSTITTKFARSKLADDGTRFGAGQPIVTPKSIKAELVAQYAEMERDGLVEDAQGFAAATIVERDGNDTSRVNVLYAPNLVNGLRIFAVLAQFRS
nr:phage tail sheath subtilisin-like domain-containing protein [uncultured Roseococcus sp.]